MRSIRPSLGLLALVALTALLTACGSAGSATSGDQLAPVGEGIGAYSEGDDQGAASAAPSGAPAAPDQGGQGESGGDGVGAPIDDAHIIRTGSIDLEVADVAASLAAARDGIRALGGYIGASTTQNEGDTPIASVTYRVPADQWEAALDLLRGISGPGTKVVAERTEAVEVTGAVIDLEARIRNLRASEAALQAIAADAVRVSDVLEVQAQLTDVRGQIEQLTAQLTDLEDRAAFATLTASYRIPVVAVDVAQKGWDPSVVVDEASASLIDVLQALTTAGIWFAIVWLPILFVGGIIVGIVAWILRRVRGGGADAGTGTARPGGEAPVAG
jgi:hypothetical protein